MSDADDRLGDTSDSERMRATLRDAALSAINTGRPAMLEGLLKAIQSCDTMLKGLPEIVEVLDPTRFPTPPDVETIRLKLGEFIRQERQNDDVPAGALEEFRAVMEDVAVALQTVQPYIKSMRALAKGQIALARHLRLVSMVLLIAVSSDDFTSMSAKLAMKLGAGDEALREMMRAKMGGR